MRCYALDCNCWDDGIGYVISADSIEKLDKAVKYTHWSTHPYQQFVIAEVNTQSHYYGKVIVGKKIPN